MVGCRVIIWANDDLINRYMYSLPSLGDLNYVDMSWIICYSTISSGKLETMNLIFRCLPPPWTWKAVKGEVSISIQHKPEYCVTIHIHLSDQITIENDRQHVGLFTKLIDSSPVLKPNLAIKGWLIVGFHKHFTKTSRRIFHWGCADAEEAQLLWINH